MKGFFKKDRVEGEGEFIFDEVSKGRVKGMFREEMYRSEEVRKVICNDKLVSKAVWIDFEKIMERVSYE